MWINLTTGKVLLTHAEVRADASNISFPSAMTEEMMAEHGYAQVTQTAPGHDPIIESAVAAPPVEIDGVWTQQWKMQILPHKVIAANQLAANSARVAALWQAAHDYEYAQISGSAIGLLTLGVLQGKPKCIAVQNWIQGLWALYYERKAGTSTNCNFSAAGPCPHSIPDLMTELSV